MRTHRTISRAASARALCVAGVLLTWACHPEGNALWSRSPTEEKRNEARQRWDSVRGGVMLQLAEQHLEAGRLDDAEKELEQALATSSDNPLAYLLVARLRLEQSQLAKAREAITIALSTSGGDPEIDYFAGIVAQRYGDLETAVEHYSTAAMRAPNIPAYVLARAETLVALGKPIEALESIAQRISDFDGNVPMRMLAAQIYRMLGLRGPVVEQCREVLRARDDDPMLCAEVGLMLVWAEQYAEAIALLRPLVEDYSADHRSLIALEPGSNGVVTPAVAHALARAYLATGQWREAQWALKPVMASGNQDAVGRCLYARAALMLDEPGAAAEVIATVHQANAPMPEALLLAAYVAFRRGDYAGARDAAEAALELDERLVAARCLIGQAAAAMGQEDRAQRAYEEALELDPSSPIALTLLGTKRPRAVAEENDGQQESRRVGTRPEPRQPVTRKDDNGRWTVVGNEIVYTPGNR